MPGWIVTVVVAVLLVGGGVEWATQGGQASTTRYLTAVAARGSVVQAVAATGTVEPAATLSLTFGGSSASAATGGGSTTASGQSSAAPHVRAGQPAQIAFNALGVTGSGVVAAAPLEPSTTGVGGPTTGAGGSDVVTYPVTIAITDAPPGLLPGMSAQVSWTAATRVSVLAVPTQAVHSSDTGDVVWVLAGNTPHLVGVTLGLSTSSLTEIIAGLRAGDRVVTGVLSGQ